MSNRYKVALCAIICLLFAAAHAKPAQDEQKININEEEAVRNNLIVNNSFEEDMDQNGAPDGWNLLRKKDLVYDNTAFEGKRSVCFNLTGNETRIESPLKNKLKAGHTYTLSVMMKTENLDGDTGVYVTDECWRFGPSVSPAKPTSNWKRYLLKLTVPGPQSPNYRLILYAHPHGSGKVWFDNILLWEDEKASMIKRSNEAVVCVGKTDVPPKIDGSLDDDCWKESIEITPFLIRNRSFTAQELAREQTATYMCYDKTSLYIGFKCFQECLEPVRNQLDAFKKKTTQHDSDSMWNDDVVVVLLDTKNDKKGFYELVVNGGGATIDASCKGDNPCTWWGIGRNMSWESRAQTSVSVNNGYWTAEISIPFSSLGVFPSAGQRWGICLGRINQASQEGSTWNPMEVSFHNANEFGLMEFAWDVPALKAVKFGKFTRGSNHLNLIATAKQSSDLRISAYVNTNIFCRDYAISSDKKEICHNYLIEQDGKFAFQFEVGAAKSAIMYYRSPVYFGNVRSYPFKVEAAGIMPGLKLYLDGGRITGVTNKTATIFEASVNEGVHTLCMKALEKPAALNISGDNLVFGKNEIWKYSPIEETGWMQNEFNDDKWEITDITKTSGNKLKGFFRKQVLVDFTFFWPNNENTFYIAENSVQTLFLVVQNNFKNEGLKNYLFYLSVPEEFDVLGATRHLKKWAGVTCQKTGNILVNGKTCKQYLISAISNDVPYKKDAFEDDLCAIAVKLPVSGQSFKTRKAEFCFYMEADKGAMEENHRKLNVVILPPLCGKQSKSFIWQLWSGTLFHMDDINITEAILPAIRAAGFNEIQNLPQKYQKNAMRGFQVMQDRALKNQVNNFLKLHPEYARVDDEGKAQIGGDYTLGICTTIFLEDKEIEKLFQEMLSKQASDCEHINLDYESPVFTGSLSCYCFRCLERFKNFSKLDASLKLTPDLIRGQYKTEWIKFMNNQFSLYTAKCYQATKNCDCKIKFSVYSGYQSDNTKQNYGVDWSLLGDKIDMGICGFGRPVKEMKDTLSALGNTPLVMGLIIKPWLASDPLDKDLATFITKACVMRKITDGAMGIMVYNFPQMDGRSFYALAEISRLVSDYEDILYNRHRDDDLVDISGLVKDDVAVYTKGNQRLVVIVNESDKDKRFILEFKTRGKIDVSDYFDKKQIKNINNKLADTVYAQDVKAYYFQIDDNKTRTRGRFWDLFRFFR